MAPSNKELEAAFIDGTCEVYGEHPDATSVNKVRRHVEQKLDLDDGFFAGDDKLLDGWTPEAKGKNTDAKNGLKRPSDEPESPRQKRRKPAPEPRIEVKREQSGKNRKAKKASARRKPEADEESDEGSPASHKSRPRKMKDESEDEGKDSEYQDVPAAQNNKDYKDEDDSSAEECHAGPPPTAAYGDAVAEEEEYSDVIDEAPQPKRRKKDKKEASSKPSKAASKKVSASTADDADEAEIKKLQSQLVKCGVRKLWHNELKRYGDDGRAKIRHLKKMLAEIGMSGRFSEAKAREIKEMRKILADAEAAQDMNRLWGMSSDGRASRNKNKRAKTEESDGSVADGKGSVQGGEGDEGDDGNDKDDDDDDAGNTFAARRRRAQADLAFLGDDSDSN